MRFIFISAILIICVTARMHRPGPLTMNQADIKAENKKSVFGDNSAKCQDLFMDKSSTDLAFINQLFIRAIRQDKLTNSGGDEMENEYKSIIGIMLSKLIGSCDGCEVKKKDSKGKEIIENKALGIFFINDNLAGQAGLGALAGLARSASPTLEAIEKTPLYSKFAKGTFIESDVKKLIYQFDGMIRDDPAYKYNCGTGSFILEVLMNLRRKAKTMEKRSGNTDMIAGLLTSANALGGVITTPGGAMGSAGINLAISGVASLVKSSLADKQQRAEIEASIIEPFTMFYYKDAGKFDKSKECKDSLRSIMELIHGMFQDVDESLKATMKICYKAAGLQLFEYYKKTKQTTISEKLIDALTSKGITKEAAMEQINKLNELSDKFASKEA